jgi:4-hydroxy-3-polyprenylbenzoate decarboxylase
LLFQNPTGHSMPVLGNLFGTQRRVALGMGADSVSELRKIGHVLSRLKEPEPPKDFKDLMGLGSLVKAVWDMAPKELRGAKCQGSCGKAPMSICRNCRSSTAGRATWRR